MTRRTATLLALMLVPMTPAADSASGRVLFIGNSLTYSNRLPEVVAAVAALEGRTLHVGMLALPGHSLEEHVRGMHLADALGRGWDVVVLQQGPSSTSSHRRHLLHWSGRIAAEVGDGRARLAFFAPWPERRRRSSLRRSLASYRAAATAVDGCILPVGSAWDAADGPGDPYSEDGLHPSAFGTLVTALVAVRGLLGSTPSLERLDALRTGGFDAFDQPRAELAAAIAAANAAYVAHPTECSRILPPHRSASS